MYIHTPRTLRVGYSYPLSLSEMEQFIKTVDLHSLSKYMKYTFGIDANLTIKIDHDLHDFWISIYSDDNLTSQCGIMSNSLKNVRFKSTQSSLLKKLISFRNENDTTFADPILWIRFELTYDTMLSKGNCLRLFDACYRKSVWSYQR